MDFKIIRKILIDFFRFDRPEYPKADVLTVAHDNDRSFLLSNGKYYSPLIDTIEDDLAALGVSCVSIARVISTIKGEYSYGNVYSPEGRFARALISKRIKGVLFRGRYPYSVSEEKIWGDILDKTGAKKALAIQPSREMCVACHKRGVWVADVQHGVIADTHPWYGESFRAKDPADFLPDAFLCWDKGSQQVINKWACLKSIKTVVIGNRWLSRFVTRSKEDLLIKQLFANFDSEVESGDARKEILVSLSWGVKSIKNGFLPEGLETLIRHTGSKYKWLIRLHPNQIKGFASNEHARFIKYYNSRLVGCAEWEKTTSNALPVALQKVSLHISWNSSVSLEAAALGIKTALLDPDLRDESIMGDYYGYYRQLGLIDLITDGEVSIQEWIDANIDTLKNAEDFKANDLMYQRILNFVAEKDD